MAIAPKLESNPSKPRRVYYPTSDGEPMGETDQHVQETFYCISALQIHFAPRPDVYVAGDNFFYYQQGNPRAVVSPDCYVVFGVKKKLRESYLLWREGGKLPSVVFEITSKKTRGDDVDRKFQVYQNVLRVPEYFLFDPKDEYLKPPLKGYRLVNGVYVPIESVEGRLHSEQLGLDLLIVNGSLRFYDPARQRLLPSASEMAEQVEQETQRAEQEMQRAEAAETEVARLRAELEALRRQQ